jgi:hypothetical protein
VRDGLTLPKLRAEHPTLTLIELFHVQKKHEKQTLACKGDTLIALLVWFHHNLAGFSNSNNDFCCFLIVITPILMALTYCEKLVKFFTMINKSIKRKNVTKSLYFTYAWGARIQPIAMEVCTSV